MDEVKLLLKEARDYIEKNEFEDAIKSVKKVLKKDKNNYMGLVLLGVALQDADQVPLAYKKAISVNKEKPLAWQGLASYYERNNVICEDLIQSYISMCHLETDFNKYKNIYDKILDTCIKSANIQYCSVVYEHALTLEIPEKKLLCCNILNNIILNLILEQNQDTEIVMKKIFTLNCKDSLHNEDFDLKFFEFFMKSKGYNEVSNEFKEYIISSNISQKIADVFMKGFIMEYINDNKFCSQVVYENDLLSNILKKYPCSEYLSLVESLLLFNQSEYYEGYCKIKMIRMNEKNHIMVRVIIGNICLKLKRWIEAESVSSVTHHDTIIQRRLLKIRYVALCSQPCEIKCKTGLRLKPDIEDKIDQDEIKATFYAFINIKDYGSAEKCLPSLSCESEFICLNYILLSNVKNMEDAINFLLTKVEQYSVCWLYLAIHYVEIKQFDKALIPLLKAAKAEKHNYLVFLYLGDYYSTYEGNLEKAKKCYLKAFTLNPECSKAGKRLSNTYRNLKNWDANYEFLKHFSFHKKGNNSWTWLELGLHHFALEEWDEAIVNLRSYVRLESSDVEAWESLADAYYSRGSYTSALKCYEKSTQLDSTRNYSLVQIGGIHCLLGNYIEALSTFHSVGDNIYLPVLKGLSDVHLAIANEKLSQNLYESCRNHAQKAIDYISKALIHDHEFVCMWTDLYAAVFIIAKLPSTHRWLHIHSKFWKENDGKSEILLSDEELFNLSANCLCKAISFTSPTNVSLCYKLGIVYFDYYRLYGNTKAIQNAFIIIKNCIKMKCDNWQYWNILGVICMSKDIKKYVLAQHAFLKALTLEFNNAMVWSNLGVIYLFFSHVVLANKAFQKAQQFDPLYMQSWIGQALIAESIDHSDAMGLFLHSAQLGFHKENSIGYSECVCKNLFSKQHKLEYSMKNMHAVPIACDLMTWLCEYENTNSYCLNILGILQEKIGLLNSAIATYEKGLTYVEEDYKDTLLFNYGRSLYLNGKYYAAIDVFKSIKEEHLSSYCGLTLCLNKLQKYQEAYTLYGTAYQWLSSNDSERAQLLIALASTAYKNNDIDDCKTLIYQSIDGNNSYICIPVILATYALSILTSDQSLYSVVINYLKKLNVKNEHSDVAILFEIYNLLKYNNTSCAMKKLQHYIHNVPSNVTLWQLMTKLSSLNFSYPRIGSLGAQKLILLTTPGSDLISHYETVSIAETSLGNVKKGLKYAQMAIHLQPDKAENWILLLFACSVNKESIKYLNNSWIKSIINFTKKYIPSNKDIQNWFQSCEHYYNSFI